MNTGNTEFSLVITVTSCLVSFKPYDHKAVYTDSNKGNIKTTRDCFPDYLTLFSQIKYFCFYSVQFIAGMKYYLLDSIINLSVYKPCVWRPYLSREVESISSHMMAGWRL